MIGSRARKSNSALHSFEALIGEWQATGSHPYLPNIVLTGRASFEWIENGAFVLMRTQVDHPEIPDGLSIFGSDDVAGTFHMIYFDERGVSRHYDVLMTDNQLRWWRDDDTFSQRFTMDIEKDKLVSYGEMSRDGVDWEKDLSLTCVRLQSSH